MNIRLLEKLYSKRNNVYKVEIKDVWKNEVAIMVDAQTSEANFNKSNLYILKKYKKSLDVLEKENQNLEYLKKNKLAVPKVVFKDYDKLILEYIPGEIVCDLLEKQSMGKWIDEFARWMADLHKIENGKTSLLKMDVNLKNFIFNGDKIYGLDFEEMGHGDPRYDLANICFFILTNSPSFTREKHLIMGEFLRCYEKHSQKPLRQMGKFLRWSKEESKRRRSGRKNTM